MQEKRRGARSDVTGKSLHIGKRRGLGAREEVRCKIRGNGQESIGKRRGQVQDQR